MANNWITGVLRNSHHGGTNLLTLVILADSAQWDTGETWLGIPALAKLTRTSERTVQRCLRDLEESGEVETLPKASPLKTNIYRLNPTLEKGDKSTPRQIDTMTEPVPDGDNSGTQMVTPMSPNPLVNPKLTQKDTPSPPAPARQAPEPISFPHYARNKSRTEIPDDWQPDEITCLLGHNVGLTSEQTAASLDRFEDHNRKMGNLVADWQAAARMWLKEEPKHQSRARAPTGDDGTPRKPNGQIDFGELGRRLEAQEEQTKP